MESEIHKIIKKIKYAKELIVSNDKYAKGYKNALIDCINIAESFLEKQQLKNKIMNLQFIQLANYFPYELSILDSYGDLRVLKYTDLKNVSDEGNIYGIKPILRPLDDLNTVITDYKGSSFIPSERFELVKDSDGDWCSEYYADQCENPKAKVMVTSFNDWLFELHFDIYGLIENGLAIDINTIK